MTSLPRSVAAEAALAAEPQPTESVEPTERTSLQVVVLSGEYGAAQTPALRELLIGELKRAESDLLIDARQVTGFTDDAMTALTAARSWAKYRTHHVVIMDSQDGVLSKGLRRTGRHFRFPVYPDVASAVKGLAAAEKAQAGGTLHTLPSKARPRPQSDRPDRDLANPGRNQVD